MITQTQLLKELKKATEMEGSQQKWAEENGLSASYVSDILKGKRGISEKVAKRLGYAPVRAFRKKDKS